MKCDNRGKIQISEEFLFGFRMVNLGERERLSLPSQKCDLDLRIVSSQNICFFFPLFRPDSALGTISKHDFNWRLRSFRHDLRHLAKCCFIVEIKELCSRELCLLYRGAVNSAHKELGCYLLSHAQRARAATQVKKDFVEENKLGHAL